MFAKMLLLLYSHSHDNVHPDPQRNVSMAAVRGAVRPSRSLKCLILPNIYTSAHLSVPQFSYNLLTSNVNADKTAHRKKELVKLTNTYSFFFKKHNYFF